jgi:hypothetical protein
MQKVPAKHIIPQKISRRLHDLSYWVAMPEPEIRSMARNYEQNKAIRGKVP